MCTRVAVKHHLFNAEIRTQVVVIRGPMPYQLDHKGKKDNNYVFVVLLIHTLTQYKYVIINSLARNFLLVTFEVIKDAHCCLYIK